MKSEECSLLELLEGSKTRFNVPAYQRNYDWRNEQCKQLLDDLIELIESNSKTHFFGSIVSQINSSGNRIVIDGQQRITTSFLLLIALVRLLQDGLISSAHETTADMITEEYLIDKWNTDDSKLKLKLVKDDQAAFEAIYKGDEEAFINSSNVTLNYKYFLERIPREHIDADQLLEAIKDLTIIDIKLSSEDDAQRIFESLNSTGLALREGDKIRNFILMGMKPEDQDYYYEHYWNPIEKNTNYDVSAFIRTWLAAVRRKTPPMRKVYTVFKEYVKDNKINTADLLEDLFKYSKYYKAIISADSGNKNMDIVLRRLQLIDLTIMYPYLLNLFEYRRCGNISDEDMITCLRTIESYLFRRWVCSVPTNALNKVFETLHSETERGVNEGGTYPDVLNRVLLSKVGSSRYPNDKELLEAFDVRDFYHINNNIKGYLYDRLENGDSLERVEVVNGLNDETFSVEHIMPQTLSDAWKKDLGKDADRIHERWLNSMANLTLTAYNSKYSNRRFITKCTIKDGFADSSFNLNKFVGKQTEWGEKQLKQRDVLMKKQFLELWPMITSSFKWNNDDYDTHALDDDFDFTDKKIVSYSFMGMQTSVNTWADMFNNVMSQIYELDPAVLHKFVTDDSLTYSTYFNNREKTNKSFKIDDGVYVRFNTSTETKISILKAVFDEADIDGSELLFMLYKDDDLQDSDDD